MKVVFGMNDFTIGGVERLFAEQIRFFDRKAFDISLITLFQFPGDPDFYGELPSDLPVHRFAFSGMRDVRDWWRLYRLLRRIKPDVVVSSLFFSNTIFRILAPFVGYRVIACEHNTYTEKTRFQQWLDRTLARRTARIVAVSTTVAEFTAKQEGIPREKFIVIHNGIDLGKIREELEKLPAKDVLKAELGFRPGDRILVDVARLTPQKNHALLIDGFMRFHAKHPEFKLVIVGGGGWQPVLEKQARDRGAGESIVFFGSRQDVWRFYRAADAFISTSLREGFGLSHAEALACGLPVVTTKTAGPDEMIKEGENGYFIATDMPDAVAVALEKLVASDFARMGAFAQASVQKYSIENAVRSYESLFRDVCAGN